MSQLQDTHISSNKSFEVSAHFNSYQCHPYVQNEKEREYLQMTGWMHKNDSQHISLHIKHEIWEV